MFPPGGKGCIAKGGIDESIPFGQSIPLDLIWFHLLLSYARAATQAKAKTKHKYEKPFSDKTLSKFQKHQFWGNVPSDQSMIWPVRRKACLSALRKRLSEITTLRRDFRACFDARRLEEKRYYYTRPELGGTSEGERLLSSWYIYSAGTRLAYHNLKMW